jgi:spoIIIJ-associated protein
VEWVEITARTVDEARELALDQLGVHGDDAEVEVLEEPRAGLFGRLRGQARVRARVRPAAPRPKVERRERRRRRGDATDSPKGTVATEERADPSPHAAEAKPGPSSSASGRRRRRGGRGGGESAGSAGGAGGGGGTSRDKQEQEGNAMPELTIDEQAEVVAAFLRGLADQFGASATTTIERVEEDTVEIRLEGDDLGLLIGPKGQTLQTVQELARTVVQRRGGGTQEGRVRIDIAGYRQRRRAALERFTEQVAADVLSSGARKALEPMNAADRKVVHDTVNGIDGVRTISEGEEPRRRVVLLPED